MQPGATRPAGVTEEHLLGQKTAGFLGVAPGFFRGPIHDPEDEARRAVRAGRFRDSTCQPGDPGV